MEFLREKVHLRIRTNTIAALARIRNCLAFATHEFFQNSGFLYVNTPIITTADCEGAGEMFQVRPVCRPSQTPNPASDLWSVGFESQLWFRCASGTGGSGLFWRPGDKSVEPQSRLAAHLLR